MFHATHPNRLADDRSIILQRRLPQLESEESHGGAARSLVALHEGSSQERRDRQQRKG
jgi:hypothetical protein